MLFNTFVKSPLRPACIHVATVPALCMYVTNCQMGIYVISIVSQWRIQDFPEGKGRQLLKWVC